MLRNVFLKSLRDARRGFAWWSVGLVALVLLIVSVYPSVSENPSMTKLIEDLPKALRGFLTYGGELDLATAPGYLGRELFSLMVPLLLLVAAIGGGAGTLAGEEERGTLELLLASPVSRRRLAVEKLAALAAELAALGFVLWVATWIGARAVSMEISGAKIAAATIASTLLALMFGAIAFLLGAGGMRKAGAIGVTAAAAVASYFVNGLAPLVDAIAGLQKASPFYWYSTGDPLRHGLDVRGMLLLMVVAAVASGAALIAFDRRDLRV